MSCFDEGYERCMCGRCFGSTAEPQVFPRCVMPQFPPEASCGCEYGDRSDGSGAGGPKPAYEESVEGECYGCWENREEAAMMTAADAE